MSKFSTLFFLSKRFLLSHGSEKFISFISCVSVLGVVLGVFALIVVTSVINGFEAEFSKIVHGLSGHVILYTRGDPIQEPDKILAKVQKLVPELESITGSFITELMISGNRAVSGAVIEGIDTSSFGNVTTVPKRIVSGRMPEGDNEVVLASVLSQKIGALVGTEVKLIFPGLEGHGSPKVVSVQVVGIVRMGMFDYDSKYIFTRLSFLQQILDAPTQVTAFKMKLKTLASSGLVAERLSKSFGYPFRAKDWSTLNKNFFYAIHLEKVVISILLAVIIIVAAFNVASTLMMMIHDKSKEIAILKALGFPASQSFRLFCYIGMGIAFLGGGLGLLLGLGANYILAKTELIRLPAQIYSLDFLPVIERWSEILIILGVALCVVFVATLIPAFHVSRKPPIEALRYE